MTLPTVAAMDNHNPTTTTTTMQRCDWIRAKGAKDMNIFEKSGYKQFAQNKSTHYCQAYQQQQVAQK